MAYPATTTIDNLNIENKNTSIIWPAYLSQTLPMVHKIGVLDATETIEHNIVSGSLAALAPYARGATLPKDPVDTSVVSEIFARFGDIIEMDYANIENARGVDQLGQQSRSIGVRILRELTDQFFNGSGTPPALTGLIGRADTTIDAATAALTLAMLYELRYSVMPASEEGLGWGANAFFSHPDALVKLLSLLGTDVGALQWVYREELNVSIPNFLGCDWIVDENIAVASDETTIYAVNLDHIRIYYADNPDYPADPYGIMNVPVPMQDDISEMGTLVTGVYAFENDPGAIAKLINVNIA